MALSVHLVVMLLFLQLQEYETLGDSSAIAGIVPSVTLTSLDDLSPSDVNMASNTEGMPSMFTTTVLDSNLLVVSSSRVTLSPAATPTPDSTSATEALLATSTPPPPLSPPPLSPPPSPLPPPTQDCPRNFVPTPCPDSIAACVPTDYICNGINECPTGEDELLCSQEFCCPREAAPCRTSSNCADCVLYADYCNGVGNCEDSTDEAFCFESRPLCANRNIPTPCIELFETCIDKNLVCDGRQDCSTDRDERFCLSRAEPPAHRCSDNMVPCRGDLTQCVHPLEVCNGVRDCDDGSDEEFCSADTCPPDMAVSPCSRDIPRCIPTDAICNRVPDCPGGEDEMFCDRDMQCASGMIPCRADFFACVTAQDICDGFMDCLDGTDEYFCGSFECPQGHARSPCDGDFVACIDATYLCDSESDCSNSEDENPLVCQMLTGMTDCGICHADASCVELEGFFSCLCNPGFTGDGYIACTDIDECIAIPCGDGATCTNTVGSFACECGGFMETNDNMECRFADYAIATIVVVVALFSVVVFVVVLSTLCCCCARSRIRKAMADRDLDLELEHMTRTENEYFRNQRNTTVRSSFNLNIPEAFIINSCNLQLGKTIGQGEFGIVYKGYLKRASSGSYGEPVAVKTLKGFLQKELVRDLLRECDKMQGFDHPNVLKLLGVCLDGGPTPYIVTPFMTNGSLLSYLRQERENLSRNTHTDNIPEVQKKLLDMCIQVVKGMEYLSSKRVVHRDLAARNCMINANFVIKVADFGLSESIDASKEYFRQNEKSVPKLPIKWLALESITDGIFSEKTDVWAFGVTCWEIFSCGKTPYAGVHPLELSQQLEKGYRMDKPLNLACPDEMYILMKKCWECDPDLRPSFSQLQKSLSRLLVSFADYLDFLTIHNTNASDTPIHTTASPSGKGTPPTTPDATPPPGATPPTHHRTIPQPIELVAPPLEEKTTPISTPSTAAEDQYHMAMPSPLAAIPSPTGEATPKATPPLSPSSAGALRKQSCAF